MIWKRVSIFDLPVSFSGKDRTKFKFMTKRTHPKSSPLKEINILQAQIEFELGERLKVPIKLTRPDSLIQEAKKRLEEITERGHSIMRPSYKSGNHLDIFVSKKELSRALRFFDTLIKVLRSRNHSIEIRYDNTEVIVFGERIKLKLREKFKKVNDNSDKWGSVKYIPTGILYLLVDEYSQPQWSDEKVPVEKQLSNTIAWLEIKGRKLQKERFEFEIERQKQEEVERIRMELVKRQENELIDFKLLLKKVERWQELKLIRGYIDELEAKSIEMNLYSQEIKDWIEWGRKKADWYDPHINAKDELLSDVDRDTLKFKSKSDSFWL